MTRSVKACTSFVTASTCSGDACTYLGRRAHAWLPRAQFLGRRRPALGARRHALGVRWIAWPCDERFCSRRCSIETGHDHDEAVVGSPSPLDEGRSYGVLSELTLRLTYRRRDSRWSANKISEFSPAAERKTRAAVRCRRFVRKLHWTVISPTQSAIILPGVARPTPIMKV
jgi:hypothetical protein